MNKYKAIILAGGMGKRMQSDIPKVLHKVFDKTIIDCVIDACRGANIQDICVVVGNKAELVKESIQKENITFALQEQQLGTGHAVICAEHTIEAEDNILVINGDMPLISSDSINEMFQFFSDGNFGACIITAILSNPTGYGRIIRKENGLFSKIVEQKDATAEELNICEGNLGVYCFKGALLKKALKKLDNNNAQKEYYLTDVLSHIRAMGENIGVFNLRDTTESVNVNSRLQLAETTEIYLKKVCNKHMENGVTIIHPAATAIGFDVKIGKDTIIYPGTIIEGKTIIGAGCVIGPNSRIIDSVIGSNVSVETSKVLNSKIADNCKVGPFANIRPNVTIDTNSKIGAFVELKNSDLGKNTRAAHHLYIGDSSVGNNVEFGCGVITVNFDIFENKHKTVIRDNAFIGCNSNLISPITIGENAIVAAGSTVTNDVSDKSLAIARAHQVNKDNWANKLNK
ncbi:MAG: bifunctional UDP-N-acetylglucosamine diphosphorylase/glucosamine-1-phosphate N-acetyltransferase GlmU [Clostridia bacterium]